MGGHPHKKQRVIMGEGQPAEYAALQIEKPQFSCMKWGAIVIDSEFVRKRRITADVRR